MMNRRIRRIIIMAVILEVPILAAVYAGAARPLSGSPGEAFMGSSAIATGLLLGWLFLDLRRSGLFTSKLLFWSAECQFGFGMFVGGLAFVTIDSRHFQTLGWIACGVFVLASLAASVMLFLAMFRLGRSGKARTPPDGERGYNDMVKRGEKKNEER